MHHDELGPLMRRRLAATIDELSAEFHGVFSPGTVERFVHESSDRLGDRPTTGPNFLPLLVGRFARDRLWALAQAQGRVEKTKPEVLFVCARNAGRSQMAAALTQHLSAGWIAVRSAGSQPGERIEPAVIEVMHELGIDVTEEFPKPLTDEVVRAADVVITMGCGDSCPIYPGKHYEDWGVADPAHQSIEVIRAIRDDIRGRVSELVGESRADIDGLMQPQTLSEGTDRYMIGPLELAPDEMLVTVAGQHVWLTRRELDVLRVLAERPRRPVARADIHRLIWGPPVAGFKDRSVEVHIRRLRVKLGAAAPQWECIHTHHAIGYRLEPEPREEGS